ncbi:hypothetical protein [Streptomyces sp. NRRL F-2580]|nr:hypothetical protein [Streptomyces sp. NRRL F-2580]
MPELKALASVGYRLELPLQALREVLLQAAVLQEDVWQGAFALAAREP